MIDTLLSLPGVFFCLYGRLKALFRAAMDFPVCYLKRPENDLRTPHTPALTVCITSLSVSPVPAASPAAKYCLRSA